MDSGIVSNKQSANGGDNCIQQIHTIKYNQLYKSISYNYYRFLTIYRNNNSKSKHKEFLSKNHIIVIGWLTHTCNVHE